MRVRECVRLNMRETISEGEGKYMREIVSEREGVTVNVN